MDSFEVFSNNHILTFFTADKFEWLTWCLLIWECLKCPNMGTYKYCSVLLKPDVMVLYCQSSVLISQLCINSLDDMNAQIINMGMFAISTIQHV